MSQFPITMTPSPSECSSIEERKENTMIGALVAKKAVAASFEAMNQHDLTKFMPVWRDDCVFIYPGEIYASGTFRGKSAVEG